MKDFIILGAGIGGLTLAYRLQQAGCKVAVIEADEQVGGAIKTKQTKNCLLELGPNTVIKRPALEKLIEDLGLSERALVASAAAKQRFILQKRHDKFFLQAAPRSPLQFLKSPIIGPGGKARLLCEPLVRKTAADDEDVHSFFSRHFGAEFSESIIETALGGIWAADAKRLSARSAFPELWALEQTGKSLFGGLAKNFGSRSKGGMSLLSFPNGLRELTDALASKLLPDTLRLGARVRELAPIAGGINVYFDPAKKESGQEVRNQKMKFPRVLLGRKIIFTTPAQTTAELLQTLTPELGEKIASIPYAPLGVMHLTFSGEAAENIPTGFGFLVPEKLGLNTLGVLFNSDLFEGRAPAGAKLLTVFCGGMRNPDGADVTTSTVRAKIVAELQEIFDIKKKPEILDKHFYPAAIPNFALGHHAIQERLRATETALPSIRFLANWDAGHGVPERIEAAEKLAAELVGADSKFVAETASFRTENDRAGETSSFAYKSSDQ